MRTVLLLLGWLWTCQGTADELIGQVVSVTDGDTLVVVTANDQRMRVRLSDIDAPEKDQPHGLEARHALVELVLHQTVRLDVRKNDRYGRQLARVFVNGTDVNAELVKQGHVWIYRQYSRDPSLLEIEQSARETQRGLWALPDVERIPPWQWRQLKRQRHANLFSVIAVRYI